MWWLARLVGQGGRGGPGGRRCGSQRFHSGSIRWARRRSLRRGIGVPDRSLCSKGRSPPLCQGCRQEIQGLRFSRRAAVRPGSLGLSGNGQSDFGITQQVQPGLGAGQVAVGGKSQRNHGAIVILEIGAQISRGGIAVRLGRDLPGQPARGDLPADRRETLRDRLVLLGLPVR